MLQVCGSWEAAPCHRPTVTPMSEHIKVELDFIPVEERLPTEEQAETLLLILVGGEDFETAFYMRYARQRIPFPADWMNREEEAAMLNVTHWAEIPKIEEKL